MAITRFRMVLCAVSLFALGAAQVGQAATIYTIQNLLAPGASAAEPYRLNDFGQVVGTFLNGAGRVETFVWNNGLITTIPALTAFGTIGRGINNSGNVVGVYYPSSSGSGYSPFFSNGLTTSSLPTLGGSNGTAYGVNDAGTITGGSDLSGSNSYRATIWQGNHVLDLGTLANGDASFGANINASGQVAGFSTLSTANQWHAFFWDGNQMRDLGTLGGQDSFGLALNDAGQVVGHSLTADPNSGSIAFLWDGMAMQSLGHLGGRFSLATAINSPGVVVGRSVGSDGIESRAFVWDSGTMRDLNAALVGGGGWQLRDASDINDRGQIVGTGLYNGQFAAFLLTPVAEVPEPNELLMVGLVVSAIVGFKRVIR